MYRPHGRPQATLIDPDGCRNLTPTALTKAARSSALAKEQGEISYRVTIPCTRAQGEAIADAEDLFPDSASPPVVVADEPDESRPDEWLIHAYFDAAPTDDEIWRG